MAKYKKGERIRIGITGDSQRHEGKLVHMKLSKEGILSVRIEKDNGLPTYLMGLKPTIIIERLE